MEPNTPVLARLEAQKKAKRLALKILRRRRTILKNIHRFSEEFGLKVYVHLEKNSRYGSYDVYSSHDPLHPSIVSLNLILQNKYAFCIALMKIGTLLSSA